MIGKGLHEVVREAEAKARNPFVFKNAFCNIIANNDIEVACTVVQNVGTTIRSLAKHLQSEL